MTSLNSLPPELLEKIFLFLPPKQVATRLRVVSKTFRTIVSRTMVDSKTCQLQANVLSSIRFLMGVAAEDRAGRFGVAHEGDFAKWALDPFCVLSVIKWRTPRGRRANDMTITHPHPRGRAPLGKRWDPVNGGFCVA